MKFLISLILLFGFSISHASFKPIPTEDPNLVLKDNPGKINALLADCLNNSTDSGVTNEPCAGKIHSGNLHSNAHQIPGDAIENTDGTRSVE